MSGLRKKRKKNDKRRNCFSLSERKKKMYLGIPPGGYEIHYALIPRKDHVDALNETSPCCEGIPIILGSSPLAMGNITDS